jgi:hypothetical protein
VYDLSDLTRIGDVKADGTLGAVEVIVKAGGLCDKEGSGDSLEVESLGEAVLEVSFNKSYCPLCSVKIESG